MKILFVLPGQGGGGGSHSVVQESLGLTRLGANITIATSRSTLDQFRGHYPEIEGLGVAIHPFEDATELATMLPRCDIVCATNWASVHIIVDALAGCDTKPMTAYYVQDYEPLFCIPGSPQWESARRSYETLPHMQMFAKTRFLCDIVTKNHGKHVAKVSPSIDHEVYFPGAQRRGGHLTISAMIRPKTPRRAPRRTARILEKLADRFGRGVKLISFGCPEEDMSKAGIRLSDSIEHRGPLSRREVADVLRSSDIFLDLSDYQAFGRTGLEGMACGCVPILPIFGGATEYLKHWTNGFLVDTRSDEEIMSTIEAYVTLPAAARNRMRHAAIETALDYSIGKAAHSEWKMFQAMLPEAQAQTKLTANEPVPTPKKKDILFLCGVPRSGTTALTILFNSHPDIFIGDERFKNLPRRELTPDLFTRERYFDARPEDTNFAFSAEPEAITAFDRASLVGDKVPNYYASYAELLKQFPGCKIVYIFRDLHDVAASWNKRATNPADRWPTANDYSRAVKEWNASLKTTIAFARANPDRFLIVRYEELFSGDEGLLRRMLAGLDLGSASAMIEKFRTLTAGWKDRAIPRRDTDSDQYRYLEERADMAAFAELSRMALPASTSPHIAKP